MATGPGSAPYNTLPNATTIGLTPSGSHPFEGSIEIGDVDEFETLTTELQVTSGWLSLDPDGPQVREVTLTGTVDEINDALRGLTYHAPETVDFDTDPAGIVDNLVIETKDGDGRADIDEVVFRITADGTFTNAAPINSVPHDTFTVGVDVEDDGVDTVHRFCDSIQVSDPRGIPEGGFTVRLGVDHGRLIFAFDPSQPPGSESGPPAGVTVEFIPGSEGMGGYWELSGALDEINLALVGLAYSTSEMPDDGMAELTIETFDGELRDTDTVAFNIVHTLTADPANVAYDDTAADDAFDDGSNDIQGRLHTSVAYPDFELVGSTTCEYEELTISEYGEFDQEKQGQYGTLYLNSVTGDYLYVPDDAAIEGAKDAQTETFHFAVYGPTETYYGAAAFSGSEGGIQEPLATQVLTIDINGVNDTPALAVPPACTYSIDSPGHGTFEAYEGELTSTDRDFGDDPRFGVVCGADTHAREGFDRAAVGSYGTLYLDSTTGRYVYEPDDAAFESLTSDACDVFTLTVTDESGATAEQTFTVTIDVGTGGAPVAVDDVQTVSEDRFSLEARVVSGSVLLNDSEAVATSGPERTLPPLRVTAVEGAAAAVGQALQGRYGTLTLQADGRYTYALANSDALIGGETGREHFTYTITNADGLSASATLEIRIRGEDLDLTRSGPFSAHRGADRIRGSQGDDRFAGRGGDDTLTGGGGQDRLWGEAGRDTLRAGEGDDQAIGGEGDDTLWLGEGADRAWGEAGRDVIFGEAGADTADGGADEDRLVLGAGADRGWGGAGADRLFGGTEDDWLSGDAGADALFGEAGNDRLWGGSGADVLEGGSGNDQFNGGAGADRLVLGAGNDTAWGGAGADLFVVGSGAEVIKDFQAGDRIVLAGVFGSYAALERQLRQEGDDVVIDLPGRANTLTVENVGTLEKGDFLF